MGLDPRIVAIALVVLAAPIGCKKADEEIVEPSAPTQVTSARPVDHLLPDELVEGETQALGFKLPRKMTLDTLFVDVAYATGDVPLPVLIKYVREHVRDGSFTEGENSATFEGVRFPSTPGKTFRMKIERRAVSGAKLTIQDTTPPPAPMLKDEEARWRSVGMTKDGKLLNPRDLE